MSEHVVIYYQSQHRKARKLMREYKAFLLCQRWLKQLTVIGSANERHTDIERLSALREQVSRVYVVGGDGSINIVAEVFAQTDVSVWVIPAGTGNDFARDLGIEDSYWLLAPVGQMPPAVEQLKVAIGRANDYCFVNHLGAGLTVDLMRLQKGPFKKLFGKLSYTVALLLYLLMPKRKRSSWQVAGQTVYAQIVAVSRFIGGGIAVNPEAKRQRSLGRYLLVPAHPDGKLLGAFIAILRGQATPYLELSDITTIEVGTSDVAIELDGDARMLGPVTVTIEPQALTVAVPRSSHHLT
ncbi:diacylglycerol/lipid kinase family protein [Pseudidiomarina taiwanensis]|uniref:DAGKc domain-containing protein n=1 Tax=Pseudidiomarina taiwanensis TaxID=337250 RepID=A0A432ZN23_9GAMM|nr:diacylglycerol kinase family protein [Pseudidiomarina taiwanensis]RUO79261.1 hypothetical protein CWI83_01740 [Pseudidiomarina taiwanensis]